MVEPKTAYKSSLMMEEKNLHTAKSNICIHKSSSNNNNSNNNNHVSIQHINLYEFSEVTAFIIRYTSILILYCLQKLINNLLYLQTKYSIATNKSYQSFITDIVKLKQKQFLGENILIKQRPISFNK